MSAPGSVYPGPDCPLCSETFNDAEVAIQGMAAMTSGISDSGPEVITIERDCYSQAYTLRVETQLSAEEMTASLYHAVDGKQQVENEHIWHHLAAHAILYGTSSFEAQAVQISEQEQAGTLTDPDWLIRCRHRIAELISTAIPRTSGISQVPRHTPGQPRLPGGDYLLIKPLAADAGGVLAGKAAEHVRALDELGLIVRPGC